MRGANALFNAYGELYSTWRRVTINHFHARRPQQTYLNRSTGGAHTPPRRGYSSTMTRAPRYTRACTLTCLSFGAARAT